MWLCRRLGACVLLADIDGSSLARRDGSRPSSLDAGFGWRGVRLDYFLRGLPEGCVSPSSSATTAGPSIPSSTC
jgi:hypothetical protein